MLDFILNYGIEFKLIEDLDSIENINKFLKLFCGFYEGWVTLKLCNFS